MTAEIEVNILLKLFRNKLFIGAMCLLLAGALAFGLLPRLYGAQSGTTEIVKLRQTVEYGTVITDDRISDEERKTLVSSLIKEIQIYTHEESEVPLKSISFNFPVFKDGREVQEFLWDKCNTVETVVLMSRVNQ